MMVYGLGIGLVLSILVILVLVVWALYSPRKPDPQHPIRVPEVDGHDSGRTNSF